MQATLAVQWIDDLRYFGWDDLAKPELGFALILAAVVCLLEMPNWQLPIKRIGAYVLLPIMLLFLIGVYLPTLGSGHGPRFTLGTLAALAVTTAMLLGYAQSCFRLRSCRLSIYATFWALPAACIGVLIFLQGIDRYMRFRGSSWSAFVLLMLGLTLLGWLLYALNGVRRSRADQQHDHRSTHGLCLACGYDLRGSVGQPACPECGTVIATKPTA